MEPLYIPIYTLSCGSTFPIRPNDLFAGYDFFRNGSNGRATSNCKYDAKLSFKEPEPLVALASGVALIVVQFDEMYAVPESFLEIEVRNAMTHGIHYSSPVGLY